MRRNLLGAVVALCACGTFLAACTPNQQAALDQQLALGCAANGKYVPFAQALAQAIAIDAALVSPQAGAAVDRAVKINEMVLNPQVVALCALLNASPVAMPPATVAGAPVPTPK